MNLQIDRITTQIHIYQLCPWSMPLRGLFFLFLISGSGFNPSIITPFLVAFTRFMLLLLQRLLLLFAETRQVIFLVWLVNSLGLFVAFFLLLLLVLLLLLCLLLSWSWSV